MNALRLMLGTLTVLPVRPPDVVDGRVAGLAMLLAPVGGALLAVPVWALGHLDQPLLAAALSVATLAVGSRAIHLDGLADVADGLGSRAPAERALAIMKQSDIGPFGVVALLLTLLVQVTALATLFAAGFELAAAVAVVVSRAVLAPLSAWPAARAGGLGATMAGSVGPAAAVCSGALVVLAPALALLTGAHAWPVAVTGLGLLAAVAFGHHCVRRFGGTTGDVYGACVEVALVVGLVAAAVA